MGNWHQFLPVISEILGIGTLFGVMLLMGNKPKKPLEPQPQQVSRTLTDNDLLRALLHSQDLDPTGGRELYTVWKWERHTSGVGARVIGIEFDGDRVLLVVERVLPKV